MAHDGISRRYFFYGTLLVGAVPARGFGSAASLKQLGYISGPFTMWALLGAIAMRVEGKLLWDAGKLRFTNNSEANAYLMPRFRKGWKFA